jgi:hypothetical protein
VAMLRFAMVSIPHSPCFKVGACCGAARSKGEWP